MSAWDLFAQAIPPLAIMLVITWAGSALFGKKGMILGAFAGFFFAVFQGSMPLILAMALIMGFIFFYIARSDED